MGKSATRLPVALGPERGVQLLGGEAGDEEVAVVHQGVSHAGVREVGGELGLPDTLGEPQRRARPPRSAAAPLRASTGSARRDPPAAATASIGS